MRKLVRLVGSDGTPQITEWDTETQGELPAAAVELDRAPGPFEDFIDGAWVYDAKGHADQVATPAHIVQAHMQKRIEAILVTSGHILTAGLLFEEAKLRAIALPELADAVMERSAAFEAAELERQAKQGDIPAPAGGG